MCSQIDEEVVIFVQKSKDNAFTAQNIKQLDTFLSTNKIATKIINIEEKGAPAEVSFTPFVVYRNYNGRKIYKGRYTTHRRLLNFIRTVRRTLNQSYDYKQKKVFTWKQERCQVVYKLKVTKPTYASDASKPLADFEQKYLMGLKKGMQAATYQQMYAMDISDAVFYCNFYPYIAADGKVYVSYEVYSAYDCINPIFVAFDTPAVGDDLSVAFEKAGRIIFEEINSQLESSKNGDAKAFVDASVKTVSWEQLNLSEIKKPEKQTTLSKAVSIPKQWEIEGQVDAQTPLLFFNFPPPLQQYGGQIKAVTGSIITKKEGSLEEAKGKFVVETSSVDMGLEGLTHSVKESMLETTKYPKATLLFEKVSVGEELVVGQITQATVTADFEMHGHHSKVVANAQFEPFLNQAGKVRLLVQARFAINQLAAFGIDGPEGPEDKRNTVVFNAQLVMQPTQN